MNGWVGYILDGRALNTRTALSCAFRAPSPGTCKSSPHADIPAGALARAGRGHLQRRQFQTARQTPLRLRPDPSTSPRPPIPIARSHLDTFAPPVARGHVRRRKSGTSLYTPRELARGAAPRHHGQEARGRWRSRPDRQDVRLPRR